MNRKRRSVGIAMALVAVVATGPGALGAGPGALVTDPTAHAAVTSRGPVEALAAGPTAFATGPTALAAVTSRGPVGAHAARALKATDTARLSYISASGSTLYETGRVRGTLPGSMRVHMVISATFSGSFTIYASGGSISGRGSATPKGSGVYESFSGSLHVTGGSGRFRHATGTASLYGTFNRNNYALVIQTLGTLRY